MSDNETNTEETAEETQETPTETKTFSQDEVNTLLAAEKRKIRSQFEDYDSIREKAELASELETQLAEAVARADSAEVANLKYSVAIDKGVPADLLTGNTAEELEAHAEKLLSFRGEMPPARRETHSSGNSGSASGTDIYERAAQALRSN